MPFVHGDVALGADCLEAVVKPGTVGTVVVRIGAALAERIGAVAGVDAGGGVGDAAAGVDHVIGLVLGVCARAAGV